MYTNIDCGDVGTTHSIKDTNTIFPVKVVWSENAEEDIGSEIDGSEIKSDGILHLYPSFLANIICVSGMNLRWGWYSSMGLKGTDMFSYW